MKKFISILTIVAVLFSLSVPMMAAEDSRGKQLEDAIIRAKTVFDIPEDAEFSNSLSDDKAGVATWYLYWWLNADSDAVGGDISVAIDNSGFISSYSKHMYSRSYSDYVRIPSVSPDRAKEIAAEFVERVAPLTNGQLKWAEANAERGDRYYMYADREVNGIPVRFNGVSVSLNGDTGEVESYYATWDNNIEFPDPSGVISVEAAQESFKNNTPLDLEYRVNERGEVRIQYNESREFSDYYINALTGEAERPEYMYARYTDGMGLSGAYAAESSKAMADEVQISPQEFKEIEQMENTISVAEAEQKLRTIKQLDFDDRYVLESSNLNQMKYRDLDKTTYMLTLYFSMVDGEGLTAEQINMKIAAGDSDGSAYAEFNALTGALTGFSRYIYSSRDSAVPTDRADYRLTADEFVKAVSGDKASKLKHMHFDSQAGNFYYARVEDGVYFDNDSLSVTLDPQTKKVTNFYMSWNELVDVPAVGEIIDSEAAHDILFDKVGLRLEYVKNNDVVVLAYKLNGEVPHSISAADGELLDYDGAPYKKTAKTVYNDIEGHFSEMAVRELQSVGVFLSGDSFEPDAIAKQSEYVTLLAKTGRYYFREGNTDEVYRYLVQDGVLAKEEVNPDSPVTREDAVKYLIRHLGHKKFAEIPGIFICDFEDAEDIAPELMGYAAIAKGLGIINGSDGKFMPKYALTKGEMAVVIYNCLRSEIR